MNKQLLHVLLILFPSIGFAQSNVNSGDVNYKDIIYTNEINGMKVIDSDTLYNLVENKINEFEKSINYDARYPKIYGTNKNNTEFLEIWGTPDLGFRQFYTIGYTRGYECSYCGVNIGKLPFEKFYVNNGIKLGDDFKSVWDKAHLNYFRRFKFNGVEYFYFEKGMKQEVPFMPAQIFYYKFKDNVLIEIGFGNGFEGVNPMFQDLMLKG